MNTTSTCSCPPESQAKPTNERPRYYARQLVTPEDLSLDQEYFRNKLRRHNLFLHGWGVVCGARVVLATTPSQPNQQAAPWKVLVKRGYILGPYGDEIWIEKDVCVDVRTKCVSPSTASRSVDCGCAEAQPPPAITTRQYIAIRYKQDTTRLVRVPLGGCGCETTACEYSRYADGYEICIIDHCPPGSGDAPPPFASLSEGAPPDCPALPAEPWVVLAGFTVTEGGTITLEECACRRQVLGLARYWWGCSTNTNPNTDPNLNMSVNR